MNFFYSGLDEITYLSIINFIDYIYDDRFYSFFLLIAYLKMFLPDI